MNRGSQCPVLKVVLHSRTLILRSTHEQHLVNRSPPSQHRCEPRGMIRNHVISNSCCSRPPRRDSARWHRLQANHHCRSAACYESLAGLQEIVFVECVDL